MSWLSFKYQILIIIYSIRAYISYEVKSTQKLLYIEFLSSLMQTVYSTVMQP